MANWPFLKTYDMQQTVLSLLEMDDIMIQKWQEARIKSKDDTMSYLRRPLPCEDKKVWHTEKGKTTPHFALPIQMYVGTSSKVDIQKIIDHCMTNSRCTKQIIHGDLQTFKGLIREKHINAERNNSWVPMAGEWHQVAHMTDAVVIKNWRHIYEPIAHYLNIKGLQFGNGDFFGEFIILRTKGCYCFRRSQFFWSFPGLVQKLLVYDSPSVSF